MKSDLPGYIFEIEIKVREYELDAEGIVNNANYLHYLELTRHEFCEQQGIPFKKMTEIGIVPVLSRAEIDYINPLRAGDVMVSKLNLSRKGPKFIFSQDIFKKDGSPVVHAVISVVTLENGKLSRGERLASFFTEYL